jgi:hypothetical protein
VSALLDYWHWPGSLAGAHAQQRASDIEGASSSDTRARLRINGKFPLALQKRSLRVARVGDSRPESEMAMPALLLVRALP